jgi:serine/threonine-protein kinase
VDAERWQRLSPLLDALFELEPAERARRLRELHEEDTETATELESLIALEDGHEDFLAEPLVTPPGGARPGHKLGPYRLEKLLGEGGMGQVWLAARADGLYQRRVALKLLRPGLADTSLRLRFTRERQILARLAHPHIARLLDAGASAEGWPYLALEYVDGQPITDYCREHHTPLDTRLRMFDQVCDAVSHAHANLIVHRDLKPSNILVTPGGDVRLLDFGIAKLLDSEAQAPVMEQTRTGVRAFTLHYAAPEQIRGGPITTMTDVYSLGVVLYELLTDRKPYRLKRGSDAEWEEAILAGDPTRPSQAVLRAGEEDADLDHAALRRRARLLAGDLDNIVLKTLSKRPEQRYPSVEALTLDLQRYEAGRPVLARPQSLGYRMRKYVQRHRWALGTGGLVTLVLTAALAIVAWQAREAVREAGRAQAMQDFMIGVFQNAGGARGQSLDLRDLLATAVERGSRELARQPRARAELYGVVAQLRIELGDYQEAQALLERQARIIAATEQIPTSLRLESLTQRGRVLRLLSRPRECIALMQPALAEARREQAQLPPQVTEFYSQLGRCRRANGEQRSARLLFERSLELRRETPSRRVGEVENLMDLAGLHADTGNTQVALREFESARALLRQEAGDRHPLLIDIRRNLGSLHRAHGEVARAEAELRGALAISLDVNGPEHPVTWAVRRQLAALHIDQGRFAEAENELREAHRRQAERLGADHPALATSYRSLGLLAWNRGDLDAAQSALRQAVTIRRADRQPLLLARALTDLAAVLDAGGQPQQARPLLLEARQLRQQALGEDHPLVGDVLRQLGEVELALGNTDAGEEALQRAVELTLEGYGATHPNSRRAQLALAYHDAAVGRADALARLDELAALPTHDLELRQTAWRARAYAAQLRCEGPQRQQALAELRALGEQLQQQQPEGGIVPREVAAIAADCQEPPLSERAPVGEASAPTRSGGSPAAERSGRG